MQWFLESKQMMGKILLREIIFLENPTDKILMAELIAVVESKTWFLDDIFGLEYSFICYLSCGVGKVKH